MSAFSDELTGEFNTLSGKIKDMMTSYRRGLGTTDEAARNRLFQQIEALMAEEEDVYKQLELEVRGKPADAKKIFTAQKEMHNSTKLDFLNVKQDNQRSLLLASGGSTQKVAYKDAQKEKLEASQRRYGIQYTGLTQIHSIHSYFY